MLIDWIALALSLLALALSVVAIVKLRLFQFCPDVLAGDVILPRQSSARGTRLLLPLQFTNGGNADGIIEWLAVRLSLNGDPQRSILLSPVGEVDMQRFLHARRKLTDDNTLEPFTAFPLEGRRAIAKFVLFDVAERPRAAPLQLDVGRYVFELFIKASNARQPKLERTFEHVVEQKHLDDFRDDLAVYLINYQITLPTARRALAQSEWLPRTREIEAAS